MTPRPAMCTQPEGNQTHTAPLFGGKRLSIARITVVALYAVCGLAAQLAVPAGAAAPPRPPARNTAAVALGGAAAIKSTGGRAPRPVWVGPTPLVLEANRGQAPAQYSYLFRMGSVATMFAPGSIDIANPRSPLAPLLHLTFVGARRVVPSPRHPLPGHTNYFLGNAPSHWIHDVPTWSGVDYRQIYPGIDLSFYGHGRELEYDLTAAPGADPARIALRLAGAGGVRLTQGGDIALQLPAGTVTLQRPNAYQVVDGRRRPVASHFRLAADGTVRFALGAYDRRLPLVIDPVFAFATYLAGTGSDLVTSMTTDAAGNIYLTGNTISSDFPTVNPIQPAIDCPPMANCQDLFVTELDPTGARLIYSTFLGGSSADYGGAVVVDASGNTIIGGTTASQDFPHAGAVASASCNTTASCYYLASLAPGGSTLNYSRTLGGSSVEASIGNCLAADAGGNAYLTGTTDDPSFPVTPGVLDSSLTGSSPAQMFVLKVDSTGRLVYSTIVPFNSNPANPADDITPAGIFIDAAGDATIAGSAGPGLPTTAGVIGPNLAAAEAGFLLQLNPTATALNFASYLPGTTLGSALAVNAAGDLFVAGTTGDANLPVNANAYQTALPMYDSAGLASGYVIETNATATSVIAATYLNGSASNPTDSTSLSAIGLDGQGGVFVGGQTAAADFPVVNPVVTALIGNNSVIFAQFNAALSNLKFSTYLSSADSTDTSRFAAMAVDGAGNLIAAVTLSATNFPTTPGSVEPAVPASQTGGLHSVIAKFDLSTAAPALCFNPSAPDLGAVPATVATTTTVNAVNCGNAPLTIASVAITSSQMSALTAQESCGTLSPGSSCPITLTLTPDIPASADPIAGAGVGGTVTLTDNANTIPQFVGLLATAYNPAATWSPTSVTFGSVQQGSSSPAQTVDFSNVSEHVPLPISSITASGDFSETNNCGSGLPVLVLAPVLCTINVTFTPTAVGTRTGALTILDDTPNSPHTITLTGTGTAGPQAAVLTPASLSFAAQETGTTSPAQSITLSNPGDAALTLTAIVASGDFAENNNCGSSLSAGASCTIAVTYTPTVTGAESGAITVSDNAAGSPQTATLTGTGAGVAVQPAANSSTSSTVTAGATATYSLSFMPVDGATGSFNLTCTGAPAGAVCTPNPNSISFSGSSPVAVAVTVTTTAANGGLIPVSPPTRRPWLPLALWSLAALACVSLTRRRLAPAFLALAVCLLVGCGGGGGSAPGTSGGAVSNPNATPAGTYTLTLTASNGTASYSTSLTLVVN